jgi:hypothetical protein
MACLNILFRDSQVIRGLISWKMPTHKPVKGVNHNSLHHTPAERSFELDCIQRLDIQNFNIQSLSIISLLRLNPKFILLHYQIRCSTLSVRSPLS